MPQEHVGRKMHIKELISKLQNGGKINPVCLSLAYNFYENKVIITAVHKGNQLKIKFPLGAIK
jgi:hypothetical protein